MELRNVSAGPMPQWLVAFNHECTDENRKMRLELTACLVQATQTVQALSKPPESNLSEKRTVEGTALLDIAPEQKEWQRALAEQRDKYEASKKAEQERYQKQLHYYTSLQGVAIEGEGLTQETVTQAKNFEAMITATVATHKVLQDQIEIENTAAEAAIEAHFEATVGIKERGLVTAEKSIVLARTQEIEQHRQLMDRYKLIAEIQDEAFTKAVKVYEAHVKQTSDQRNYALQFFKEWAAMQQAQRDHELLKLKVKLEHDDRAEENKLKAEELAAKERIAKLEAQTRKDVAKTEQETEIKKEQMRHDAEEKRRKDEQEAKEKAQKELREAEEKRKKEDLDRERAQSQREQDRLKAEEKARKAAAAQRLEAERLELSRQKEIRKAAESKRKEEIKKEAAPEAVKKNPSPPPPEQAKKEPPPQPSDEKK